MHVPSEIPNLEFVGTVVDDEYARPLKQRVAVLMDVNHERFPGAQPVSFAQRHLDVLEHENYFVSEKADGVRCLLYMHQQPDGSLETFLVGNQ